MKNHNEELDIQPKKQKTPNKLFELPNNIKGITKNGKGDYLIFYFYSKEDFELVKNFFEIKKSKTHPFLNSKKLIAMVKNEINKV